MRQLIGAMVMAAVLASPLAVSAQAVKASPAVDVGCGTSSTSAVAANGQRKMLTVCNVSDADVYYAWAAAAVVGPPSHVLTSKSCHLFDAKIPTDALACITATGTKHLTVQEFK